MSERVGSWRGRVRWRLWRLLPSSPSATTPRFGGWWYDRDRWRVHLDRDDVVGVMPAVRRLRDDDLWPPEHARVEDTDVNVW